MLIGIQPTQKPLSSPTASGAAPDPVFDATTEQFEQQVLKASLEKPILIDFWAPWCGPCRQLIPTLESAVRERGGQVLLAKVNVDAEPALAQAFRVQSVPMVIAFYQGQPVSGFTGARPKSDIDHLIAQLIDLHAQQAAQAAAEAPAADHSVTELLEQAALLVKNGQRDEAFGLYVRVLHLEPENPDAANGFISGLLAQGRLDEASHFFGTLPDALTRAEPFARYGKHFELAREGMNFEPSTLLALIDKNPEDLESLYRLAQVAFSRDARLEATEYLIRIIRLDRGWEDEKAKKLLLAYFDVWGSSSAETVAGRRRLSSVLFS